MIPSPSHEWDGFHTFPACQGEGWQYEQLVDLPDYHLYGCLQGSQLRSESRVSPTRKKKQNLTDLLFILLRNCVCKIMSKVERPLLLLELLLSVQDPRREACSASLPSNQRDCSVNLQLSPLRPALVRAAALACSGSSRKPALPLSGNLSRVLDLVHLPPEPVCSDQIRKARAPVSLVNSNNSNSLNNRQVDCSVNSRSRAPAYSVNRHQQDRQEDCLEAAVLRLLEVACLVSSSRTRNPLPEVRFHLVPTTRTKPNPLSEGLELEVSLGLTSR